MIAALQLNNFFAESFSFVVNPFFDPKVKEDRIAGQIGCSIEVAVPQEEGQHPYRICLEVTIDPVKEKPALEPYVIQFKIVGYFTIKDKLSDEVKERMLSLNGGTILYGIIRGIVAQTTGSGPFGKYIMPAINLVDIYEKRKKRTLPEGKLDMGKKPSSKKRRKSME